MDLCKESGRNMRPTLGLTGMDPVTELALKAAFADANALVGGHWR